MCVITLCSSLQASQSTIEGKITLDEPKAEKVPNSYKQLVRVNGKRAVIVTSNYHTEHGIFRYKHNEDISSMSVPLDDWLHSQLFLLQDYVINNTTFPDDVPKKSDGTYLFKPLLQENPNMLIPVSKWCKIYKLDQDTGLYGLVDKFPQFEKGTFSATIEVSHVYIGPHLHGHNFSISLRVKQILYSEETKDDNTFLDELLKTNVLTEKKKKKVKRNKKVNKCLKSKKTVAASPVTE